MTHSLRFLVGTLLVLVSSSCTLVADLDSYVSVDELGCDMDVAVGAFAPHLEDRVVFQAVTRDGNVLRAMAIIDPLVNRDRSFNMPNAVRQGAHALLIWHDEDRDGAVQTLPFNGGADHSWRLEDVCSFESTCADDDTNCFAHDGMFDLLTDPAELGNTLVVTLRNLELTTGMLELHLVEVDEVAGVNSVVGLYRTDDVFPEGLVAGDRTFELAGLAEEGRIYTVNVIVDRDGNGDIDVDSEVFTLADQDGEIYADPVVIDVNTADAAGALPEENILVSPLASEARGDEGTGHSH